MTDSHSPRRPTRADLFGAAGNTVPDVIGPGLRVLFCGINPSLYAGATGHHSRPGAAVGPQAERLGRALVWVLPNPSGLNAHYPPARLASVYRDL